MQWRVVLASYAGKMVIVVFNIVYLWLLDVHDIIGKASLPLSSKLSEYNFALKPDVIKQFMSMLCSYCALTAL